VCSSDLQRIDFKKGTVLIDKQFKKIPNDLCERFLQVRI
jgi:hypothetical protein